MNEIYITENESHDTIIIKGCSTKEEATEAAEKWLHERDCFLHEIREFEDGFQAFFTCDDY